MNGFASKKEAARANELQLLQKAGAIRDLRFQVSFKLIPAQYNSEDKLLERAVNYVADFTYNVVEVSSPGPDRFVVEDCKGMRTPLYLLKRKLFLLRYGFPIKES